MAFIKRAFHMTSLRRALQSQRNNVRITKEVIDLQLREMESSEKDTVLALQKNAFGGLDILPDYLDFYMNDPQKLCLTAHDGTEMVAFFVAQLVDNGQSMFLQATRVKENRCGTGIYRAITQHIPDLALSYGCKKILSVEVPSSRLPEHFKQRRSDITNKILFICPEVNGRDEKKIGQYETDGNAVQIKHVTPNDILNYYCSSQSIKDYLFPSGRFVVEFCSLALMPENLENIKGRNSQHFSSVRKSCSGIAGMLSSAFIVKHLSGTHSYNITITGRNTDDFENHMNFHCSRALDMLPGPVCFQLLVEDACLQQVFLILEKNSIVKPSGFVQAGRVKLYEIVL